MVAAGHGAGPQRQQFEADTARVTDQMTRTPVRVAYGLALYIKQAATQGRGGLTAQDIGVLDKSLLRMKAMGKAGTTLPDDIKKNLSDRMREAEEALNAAKRPPVLLAPLDTSELEGVLV